jgi:hypothetical protein
VIIFHRFSCGCIVNMTRRNGKASKYLKTGYSRNKVHVTEKQGLCFLCAIDNRKPVYDERCVAGDHESYISGDRIITPVGGTGGWDLSFRCRRNECMWSRYTTYGMKLIAEWDYKHVKIFDKDDNEDLGTD